MKNVTILSLALSTGLAHGAIASNDWESGTLEGWTYTASNGGSWINPGFGGNPGGYLAYIDGPDNQIDPPQIFAPAEYLGDYTAFEDIGYFQYDIINFSDNQNPGNYQRIRLLGANGEEARALVEYLPTDTWQTITVAITEANWQMLSGTWDGLIANVTGLYFGGDVVVGAGAEGAVDNFSLVPAPGSVALLGFGALAAARRRR